MQATARGFAQTELKPVTEKAEKCADPWEAFVMTKDVYKPAYELGFAMSLIPAEYGGAGATNVDGQCILNGRKMWNTSGCGWDKKGADVSVVIARTDTSVGGDRGLSAFIVPRGTRGYETTGILDTMGHRTTVQPELLFSAQRRHAVNGHQSLLEGLPVGEIQARCAVREAVPYRQGFDSGTTAPASMCRKFTHCPAVASRSH